MVAKTKKSRHGFSAESTGARSSKPRRSKTIWRRIWAARKMYVFIAPPVLAFLIFFAYPALFAFYSSFFKFNNFAFAPLPNFYDNYVRAIKDATLHRSFINVIEMFAISFSLGQFLSYRARR